MTTGKIEHKDIGENKCACGKDFSESKTPRKSLMGHLNVQKKGKRTADFTAEERREKFKKTGGHSGYKLDFSDRIPKGFVGRVVNDSPGRIERMLQRGYELVTETSDTPTGSDNKDIGTRISLPVDGDGRRGTLMMIREEWYEEDQKVKADKLKKIDNEILKGKVPGSDLTHSYIPENSPMKPD